MPLVPPSSLVTEAQQRRLFRDLGDNRAKSDVIWLLELASLPSRRADVVSALRDMAVDRKDRPARTTEAIKRCAQFVPGVDWREHSTKLQPAAVKPSELKWQKDLVLAQKLRPYQFTPRHTDPVVPDRHPWDGHVGDLTFTEVSAGIGLFAAAFEAAGMRCVHLIEPVRRSLDLAVQNCSVPMAAVSGLADVDPSALLWTHGLVGGPECQPFSSAGQQRAWEDPRSYTLLRVLHTMAVMQPWFVWLENVAAIETVKHGDVWLVIQEIAHLAGYTVKLKQV